MVTVTQVPIPLYAFISLSHNEEGLGLAHRGGVSVAVVSLLCCSTGPGAPDCREYFWLQSVFRPLIPKLSEALGQQEHLHLCKLYCSIFPRRCEQELPQSADVIDPKFPLCSDQRHAGTAPSQAAVLGNKSSQRLLKSPHKHLSPGSICSP